MVLCNTNNPSPNPQFFIIIPQGIWEKKEKYLPLQNSQSRASDDLDHLTLVFKEELDAITPPDLPMQLHQQPKTPTKKQEKIAKKVQTTSIKSVDNQTKIAVKLVNGERKIHPCTLC